MPFILRYNTTANGAVTFTGNALGLNKVANQNNQGAAGSIGINGSTAVLDLPVGAVVLYAELIWSASFNTGGTSVASAIANPVRLITPQGSFTVAPDPATAQTTLPNANNYVNSANVTALVQQGGGGTYATGNVPGAVTATVNNENYAGWTLAVIYSCPFRPSTAQVIATDPDGLPATTTLLSPPLNGTVVVSGDGTFTYTPNPGFVGTDSLTVLAPDPSGQSGVGTITLNIVNLPPVAMGASVTTLENIPVTGAVTATDPDGNPLNFTLNTTPVNGTAVVSADGSFTYTPNSGFVGSDSFTALVEDGAGGTAIADVTVQVTGQLLVTQDLALTTNPNTSVPEQIIATDPAGLPLSFRLTDLPASGNVILNANGSFIYTPNPEFTGMDRFTVTVTNSAAQSVIVLVTVVVTPEGVDEGPITTDIGIGTDQGKAVSGQILASDPGAEPLVYALGSAPANGSVELNPDGTFLYIPNSGFTGTDTFEVVVTNRSGLSSISRVTVIVYGIVDNGINRIQVQITTTAGTPVSGTVDGGPGALYILLLGPSNGNVIVRSDGTYIYIPNADFIGTDTFTIRYTDARGDVFLYIVTIQIISRSGALVIHLRTEGNEPLSGNLSTIGLGSIVNAQLVEAPNNGQINLNANGTFTYFPNTDYRGPDQFTFIVTDALGNIFTVIVNVLVTNGGEE